MSSDCFISFVTFSGLLGIEGVSKTLAGDYYSTLAGDYYSTLAGDYYSTLSGLGSGFGESSNSASSISFNIFPPGLSSS